MRKIVYSMQMSLDGYMEDASGSIGFTRPDAELHAYMNEIEKQSDTHIYGRRLYETMNGYWPNAESDPDAAPEEIEYARIWNGLDKLVFSQTLKSVEGRARLAGPDLEKEVADLKAAPGKDIVVGGAILAQAFIDRDLIDQYHVVIYPTLIGRGKQMFLPNDRQIALELIESRPFSSGVVGLMYRRKR